MTVNMHALFEQSDNVPQIPEVVRTLIVQLEDNTADFAEIADNIAKEQSISLKILRLVNTAYYGLPGKVSSINQALVILGMGELKQLVIVSGFVDSLSTIPGLDLNDFWLDNFRTATYAKELSKQCGLEKSEIIFTAGLINSLGKILIYLGAPAFAKKIDTAIEAGQSRSEAERHYLGFTYQQVCTELCRQWQFSEDLLEIITQSDHPLNYDHPSSAACAIYIAKYISEATYSNQVHELIVDNFPVAEWEYLGLQEDDIADKMNELQALNTGIEGLLD